MDNLFEFSLNRSDFVYERCISFYLTQIRLVILRDCERNKRRKRISFDVQSRKKLNPNSLHNLLQQSSVLILNCIVVIRRVQGHSLVKKISRRPERCIFSYSFPILIYLQCRWELWQDMSSVLRRSYVNIIIWCAGKRLVYYIGIVVGVRIYMFNDGSTAH